MKKYVVAEYDVAEYIKDNIEYFQQDKQEFAVSILWDEERDVKDITDKEIEEHFYDDVWIGVQCFEDFTYDIDEEFRKYIGKEVYVEGKNMGWRNRSGHKTFIINDPIDLFKQIVPECDLTYSMEKVKEGEYEVRIAHHDSPMGEVYNIKIK